MDNLRARNLGFETEASKKMLRDTYTLLATTMIPTAIGGLVSLQFGLANYFRGGWIAFLVTFVLMYGLIFAIEKNKSNKVGLTLLYVFTFFLGILLAGTISRFVNQANGGELIAMSGIGTMLIFMGCSAASSMFKADLGFLGKFLMVSIITIIVCTVAVMLFQLSFLVIALLAAILIISSVCLFYELSLIKQGEQDSAVSAALGIYLSLYNIFTSLLQILGIVGSDD